MRRRLLLITLAVLAVSGLTAPAGQAAGCVKPGTVKVQQKRLGALTVSWKPSAKLRRAKVSYRVLRGSTVVGQTRKRSMVVRAVAGRRITVKVGVVGAGGRAPRCFAARKVRVAAARAPGALAAPTDLSVQAQDDRAVVVTWKAVAGARSYRVLRDGRAVGQTPARQRVVVVVPGRTHGFTVVAIGSANRPSRPSAEVRYDARARPAGKVVDLAAAVTTSDAVRLTWTAGEAGTFPVRGYRVTKNGVTVGQFAGTRADVSGLLHDRQYEFSVTPIDLRGVAGPSASVEVRTSVPVPSTGKAHAFLLASTDESFRALQRRYERVGVVYPTYFDCVAGDVSQVKGKDDPLITRWAKDRKIKVLPRFNCQRPTTLREIFTRPEERGALIERLVALVDEHDYDGLNLDFEAGAPQDRDALTAFVADLAGALHRSGRKLTVDVSPKVREVPNHPRSAFYDYKMLAQHADWIWVMGWGLHWTTSVPGPIAPAPWLRQVYDYVATQPNKDRFIMGLPFYGLDWPGGGGPGNPATARTFPELQQLIARHGARVRRDESSGELTFSYTDEQGVRHEVWFSDATSLADRFAIAPARGLGGVGVWRLGQEDPAFWDRVAGV